MAFPSDINGNMPEPDEVFVRCKECELWVQTPENRVWGVCCAPIGNGQYGDPTKQTEGCWVPR